MTDRFGTSPIEGLTLHNTRYPQYCYLSGQPAIYFSKKFTLDDLRQRVNDANDEGATHIYVPSKLDSPCTTSGRLRVWYAEAIIREMEDYDAKR